VVDPQIPTTLYAGTSSGVFKSIDRGVNWTKITTVLPGSGVGDLAIDPETPTNIYVVWLGGPIYKSIDGGSTWTVGSKNEYAYALAIDQEMPSIIYTGTQSGVLKSTDGGGTWTAVNTGLPKTEIFELAIDTANPSILYAGTHYQGVYKSTNGGAMWSAANTGLTTSSAPAP
jgi:photosystem II stability/assembly factor-like uncharacterized protein